MVFTWGEEVGHRGAKAFDCSTLRAPYGFVLDALLPVGTIVLGAPGYDAFIARIRGRAAHAGVEPERGISAIAVAARAIDRLPWGRLDEVTTANIGTISGGSVRNAVPEHVEAVGEVRSLDPERLAARAARRSVRASSRPRRNSRRMSSSTWSTSIAATDWTIPPRVSNTRAALSPRSARSHTRLRLAAVRTRTSSTPPVGSACVLGIGAEACHSVRERIAVRELARSADWVLAIISARGSDHIL